jgi:hypothetical protein
VTKRTGYQPAVDDFHEAYRRRYGATPTWAARQIAQIRALVKAHGLGEVRRRIAVLFTDGPRWISEPYTVGLLVGCWDHLVVPQKAIRRHKEGLTADELLALADELEGDDT